MCNHQTTTILSRPAMITMIFIRISTFAYSQLQTKLFILLVYYPQFKQNCLQSYQMQNYFQILSDNFYLKTNICQTNHFAQKMIVM